MKLTQTWKSWLVLPLIAALVALCFVLGGCGSAEQSATEDASDKVADSSEMTEVEDVVDESMTPIYADELNDGAYPITVDSSSSMFRIDSCELTVDGDTMTAALTMKSDSYLYLYAGTAEEAAKAPESDYIKPVDDGHDGNVFTLPVEALDSGVDCAAFSKNKEKWYPRTLVFEASSLPADAFKAGKTTTVADLDLADGAYTVDVTMAGGTGRASIESPATLTIQDGKATATITWSSPNYDYMIVDDVKYTPTNAEGNSTFQIPVEFFDSGMRVIADTTAMSQPYEVEYTLNFDSSTIKPA